MITCASQLSRTAPRCMWGCVFTLSLSALHPSEIWLVVIYIVATWLLVMAVKYMRTTYRSPDDFMYLKVNSSSSLLVEWVAANFMIFVVVMSDLLLHFYLNLVGASSILTTLCVSISVSSIDRSGIDAVRKYEYVRRLGTDVVIDIKKLLRL